MTGRPSFTFCVIAGLDPAIHLASQQGGVLKLDHRVTTLTRRPGDDAESRSKRSPDEPTGRANARPKSLRGEPL
jgi:hypothetical protein